MRISMAVKAGILLAGVGFGALPALAQDSWKPSKPVEFVGAAGPGGGTDIFARAVQLAIQNHKLIDQPILVSNKGGGSGAETFVYIKGAAGDGHKLAFGTSNLYTLPMVAKVAFSHTDFVPVAAMVFDEFLLWTKGDAPYADYKAFTDAAKAANGTYRMAGALSKDTDQTLTRYIEKDTGSKFIYVPYRSGGEASVQLVGGHVQSHTNNPSESVGHWQAGQVKPLCVFASQRMSAGPKVTATQSWSDIPTCKEQGSKIEAYQMPRTVSLPPGTSKAAAEFWAGVLKKVTETPEWKEYLTKTAQTGRYMAGADFQAFIDMDEKRTRQVYQEEGWLVQ
ncbi:MAG: tripartite tricarboxylate transporter substrate binding protein [Beijerinckiaceae bacterium]